MDRRIPSLDGARALSILLVIAAHLIPNTTIPFLWRVDLGNLGVRVFFIISGFLITSLLLKEREKTGRISIGDFYLRRLFRIVPAYYTFLLVVALLIPTGWLLTSFDHLAPAAGFFINYRLMPGTLAHTWSLAVEEQFYLLWPGVLVLIGLRRAPYLCVALLFTAPVFRELSYLGIWPTQAMTAFESVCDALAVGCLLSMCRETLWNFAPYRALVNSGYVLVIPIAALTAIGAFPGSSLIHTLSLSVLNVGIAMALDRYMRLPQGVIGTALNLPPVVWIGSISYSLYLWQQPFMFNTLTLPWYAKIVGAFACATASYYWIERPFLKLRGKVMRRSPPVVAATNVRTS